MIWPVTFDRIPHTYVQAIDTTAKIPEKGSCKTEGKREGSFMLTHVISLCMGHSFPLT